jgi:hypothetical protein
MKSIENGNEALQGQWAAPSWEAPELVDLGNAVEIIQGGGSCCPDHDNGYIGVPFTSSNDDEFADGQ